MLRIALLVLLVASGCQCGDVGPADGGPDAGNTEDAGGMVSVPDSGLDAGRAYRCGTFALPSGWTLSPGFRGGVVLGADAGLRQPVALAFAGGGFGGDLYVVNQGNNAVVRFDPTSGAASLLASIGGVQQVLTSLVWDEREALSSPGALYLADQGSDGDQDAVILALQPDGGLDRAAGRGGPGMDDIYGMAFAPAGWRSGLIVGGDTDGAQAFQLGLLRPDGGLEGFGQIPGVQGMATLSDGRVVVSRPGGGGFDGPAAVTTVLPSGDAGVDLSTGLTGLHAVVEAPPGPFGGGRLYAASWETPGRIVWLEPDGGARNLATGLSLTNYDGNVLAFSPDGRLLMVADRLRDVVVCIEPDL